jgi:hypothetical protein
LNGPSFAFRPVRIVKAMGLKNTVFYLKWHDLAEFNENLSTGSSYLLRDTERQNSDLIILTFLFLGKRLKASKKHSYSFYPSCQLNI